jgi:hypothetical protein
MAEIKRIGEVNFLVTNNPSNQNDIRVFLPSKNINVFPCSRRGQYEDEKIPKHYDPEARLNTERTNRIGTAINGFKDSFIANNSFVPGDTLTFVLAGYRIAAKGFNPADIATALNLTDEDAVIYAHLSIHTGVSLAIDDYETEILYRQSDLLVKKNYLDVSYPNNTERVDDFFVGVSFTANEEARDAGATPKHLALFSTVNGEWQLVQTSLLPKIEHGETEDSIKVSGDFTVNHGDQESFKVSENETTLTNSFTIKRVSDEGEQTSFEITKQGVGTVNVPLHITKATAIDGHASFNGGTEAFSLIVGKPAEDDIWPYGTIKAKAHIETPTLEATESIKTLELKTNAITSDSAEVAVNKKLTLGANTSITAPVANVHSTLNVTNSAKNAKADIDDLMSDKATIGDLVVKADPSLNNSTGKITTLNFQATNNATIYDLDVGTNIDTTTLKATGSIETAKITSNSTEIVVDKALKVDAKLSAGATDVDSLAVDGTVYLKSTAQIDGETTLYNKLLVKSGSTIRAEIDSSKVSFNLPITAGQYINVGSPVTPTQTAGDIVAKNSIFAENNIEAKSTIKAPAIYQTVNGTNKPVPYIDLVEQDNGQWQLQISCVNKIEKLN